MQTGAHCLYTIYEHNIIIIIIIMCAEEKKEKNATRVFIQCVRSIIKYTRLWQRRCEVVSTISEINALSGR